MSYDIELVENGQTCEVPNHQEGGNIAIGGTSQASLNVTYNYACFYYWFLDKRKGIRWLYGKTAEETIPRLEKAIGILTAGLGGKPYEKDYWAATPGNAAHALSILLEWAKLHPKAIWQGD